MASDQKSGSAQRVDPAESVPEVAPDSAIRATGLPDFIENQQPVDLETARRRSHRIGAFFRQRRIQAGVSSETVIAELGLTGEPALAAYEDGAESISLDNIFTLTMLLNIPPEDVLGLMYDVYQEGHDTSL